MASGSYTFGTSSSVINGKLEYSTSGNADTKKSTVTCKVYVKKDSGYDATYGTLSLSIKCQYNNKANTLTNSISQYMTIQGGSWQLVGTTTFTVPHNTTTGQQTIVLSVSGGMSTGTFTSCKTNSQSVTLENLADRPKVTSFKTKTIGSTSISFTWSSDQVANQIWWKNGPTEKYIDVDSISSGTFTISGLEINTSYSIQFSVKSKDSGLWSATPYPTLNVTTVGVPYVSGPSSFVLNEVSSLKVEVFNPGGISHTIKAVIGETTLFKTSNRTGTDYTWNLTDTIKNTIGKEMSSSVSNTINFTVTSTINGTTYTKTYSMSVKITEDGTTKPTTPSFTVENTSSTQSGWFSDDKSIGLQYQSTMKITLSARSSAKLSSSITIYRGMLIKDGIASRTVTNTNVSSAASSITFSFSDIKEAGSYTVAVQAVDSRGFVSDLETNALTITILPYHIPRISLQVERYNGNDTAIILNATRYISALKYNDANKNTVGTFYYRYALVGNDFGTTWTSISGTTSTTVNDDIEAVNKKSVSNPLLTLSAGGSYKFEFKFSDKVRTVTVSALISEAIPPVAILENGTISTRKTPDTTSGSKALQIVGGAEIDDLTVGESDIENTLTLLKNELDTTSSDLANAIKEFGKIFPYNGEVSTFNTATTMGFYQINSPTDSAKPADLTTGFLFVYVIPTKNYIFQLGISVSNRSWYVRTRDSSTWSAWRTWGQKLSSSAVTRTMNTFDGKEIGTKMVKVTLPSSASEVSANHGITFNSYYWIDLGNSWVCTTTPSGISYPLGSHAYKIYAKLNKTAVYVKVDQSWNGWVAWVCVKYVIA